MADISGLTGKVTAANIGMKVTEWSASFERDAEVIPPGLSEDPPWEGSSPGAMRVSGSLTGVMIDTGAPIQPGTSTNFTATVTLQAHTGDQISGSMNFTNVSMTRRLATTEMTADFRNAGTVSVTGFS